MKGLMMGALCCAMPSAVLAQDPAQSCAACHRDALSLGAWEAPELAGRIREIRDGSVTHPVPLPPLSDEQIAAIAAALAGS